MITAAEYVLMAAQSYFYYRDDDVARQSFGPRQFGFSRWNVDARYSETVGEIGFSATVFRSGGLEDPSAQYVVAFRGTDDWDDGDEIWQNLLLGVPGLGPQTVKALELVRGMLAAGVPIENISFTGHSLGGALAGFAAAYFDRPAVVFDPAPYAQELSDIANQELAEFAPDNPFDQASGGPILNPAEVQAGYETFIANARNRIEIYGVQGEILYTLFDQDNFPFKKFTKIDLGDSDYQDRTNMLLPLLSGAGVSLITRNLKIDRVRRQ